MSTARRFEVPPDRHYHREHHVWARLERRTGRVRVGIDAIGLESLGDLAYVSLLDVGTQVDRGEPIGSLEAAKMTTGIAAPVGGTVVSRNDAALRDPQLVNGDPYRAGWLVEIEPRPRSTGSGSLAETLVGFPGLHIERLSSLADL